MHALGHIATSRVEATTKKVQSLSTPKFQIITGAAVSQLPQIFVDLPTRYW
jgi:hypothetical protein